MSRTTASNSLFKRACRVLVGGVNSPVRSFKAVGETPRFIRSAKGSRIIDEDGNAYVDYCLSWGPLILGHARPEVVRAAEAAARKGTTYGAATKGEIFLAEEIRKAFPSMNRVRLTSSGTEAVMSAVRLARGYTGRTHILKFTGCYHGHVDSLLVSAGSASTTLGHPDSAGVPEAWARTTITVPYNDFKAVAEAFSKWGDQIAAVIVEPIAGNMGVVLPKEGFLDYLREATSKNKSLLIFDEVITGFRLCYGGAQSLYGIKPDLTTLGKIVGGGFPLAAFGGRREIMERLAPLGPVYQAGTLSGNPVAVAAGLETLRLLKNENPYAALAKKTGWLTQELQERAGRWKIQAQVRAVGSMFTFFFSDLPVHDYETAKRSNVRAYAKFFRSLLNQGVYFPPAQFETAFLSTAHADADIEKTLKAADRIFQGLRRTK